MGQALIEVLWCFSIFCYSCPNCPNYFTTLLNRCRIPVCKNKSTLTASTLSASIGAGTHISAFHAVFLERKACPNVVGQERSDASIISFEGPANNASPRCSKTRSGSSGRIQCSLAGHIGGRVRFKQLPLAYRQAGLSFLPIESDGSKRPRASFLPLVGECVGFRRRPEWRIASGTAS